MEIQISGPVRRIGVQTRSITGTMPDGNRYESALERDFLILANFDPHVKKVTTQPITIGYVDQAGVNRHYTPDGYLIWQTEFHHPPLLYEIKYRTELREAWTQLKPKFRAARRFAKAQGWRFTVYTEDDIRGPYLDNVNLLNRYLTQPISDSDKNTLLQRLEAEPQSVRSLLVNLSADQHEQAQWLPMIWHLVAVRAIECDLDIKLTMDSLLSLPGA